MKDNFLFLVQILCVGSAFGFIFSVWFIAASSFSNLKQGSLGDKFKYIKNKKSTYAAIAILFWMIMAASIVVLAVFE